MNASKYLSAKRLAALFDPPLSIPFVRSLQKSGELPFVRVGRRVLFDRDVIEKVLKSSPARRAKP